MTIEEQEKEERLELERAIRENPEDKTTMSRAEYAERRFEMLDLLFMDGDDEAARAAFRKDPRAARFIQSAYDSGVDVKDYDLDEAFCNLFIRLYLRG
ncbi:MAG: hypothetical protein IJ802_03340 [Kiritimatiellae bacterium]|nr:hypothetical protein [Kiritimatiellia bacterium]